MMFKPSHKALILIIMLMAYTTINAHAESKEQQTMVALRAIGHEFLLQLNDSTSRVLPIEKTEGRYAVRFARDFAFVPDALIFSVQKVISKYQIQENYIVEVQECDSNKIIHSFKASIHKDEGIAACQSRLLESKCYVFYFTEIENDAPFTPVEKSKPSLPLYGLILLCLGFILYFFLYQRKKKPKAGLIPIGQYQFDKKAMMLTLKTRSIELSSKECDLLFLLSSNENITLERDYILNEVWGDDGNYVGRTLDVFISKLRKKLEHDPSLKIINVRGVGYRFVMG